MHPVRPLTILLVVLVASACTAAGGTPPSSQPSSPVNQTPAPSPSASSLDGRTFLSTTVTEQGKDRALVSGTRVSLTFQEGRVGANAGCNSMSGEFSIID